MNKIGLLSIVCLFSGVMFANDLIVGKWICSEETSNNIHQVISIEFNEDGTFVLEDYRTMTIAELDSKELFIKASISGTYERNRKALNIEYNVESATASWDFSNLQDKKTLNERFSEAMKKKSEEMLNELKLYGSAGDYRQIYQINSKHLVIGGKNVQDILQLTRKKEKVFFY